MQFFEIPRLQRGSEGFCPYVLKIFDPLWQFVVNFPRYFNPSSWRLSLTKTYSLYMLHPKRNCVWFRIGRPKRNQRNRPSETESSQRGRPKRNEENNNKINSIGFIECRDSICECRESSPGTLRSNPKALESSKSIELPIICLLAFLGARK